MTSTQMLILAGTVWVAPHVPRSIGIVTGALFLIVSCLIGLGVLK